MPTSLRWDVFCRVVDNFGDAGVCWRLARQLADEQRARVRLWIDDVASLARLAPGIVEAPVQTAAGVEVHRWTGDAPAPDALPDVVIEAFGCGLPDAYVA